MPRRKLAVHATCSLAGYGWEGLGLSALFAGMKASLAPVLLVMHGSGGQADRWRCAPCWRCLSQFGRRQGALSRQGRHGPGGRGDGGSQGTTTRGAVAAARGGKLCQCLGGRASDDVELAVAGVVVLPGDHAQRGEGDVPVDLLSLSRIPSVKRSRQWTLINMRVITTTGVLRTRTSTGQY